MSRQKHALVVDDSKSARLILRRMLEKHDILVETVESAADALDFLTSHRPDVIFMDHMMPGMDGFEAVKAIKDNPDTATIPVMMYTSKGGDLYLGQARALGAVGVLPKTVAPAELFESLKRLGLTEERRSSDSRPEHIEASERAEDIPRPRPRPVSFVEPGMRHTQAPPHDTGELDDHLRKLLDEQRVEIRKDLLLSMETVSRQTSSKLSKELEEQLEPLKQVTTPAGRRTATSTLFLALLLVVFMAWNALLHTGKGTVETTLPAIAGTQTDKPETSKPPVTELERRGPDVAAQLATGWKAIAWAMNQSLQYPYDEIALDKQRIDIIEQLLEQLAGSGFRGTIVLETHAGEFCLLGNQDSGFRLPPPDMAVDACEFIGNPAQPTDSPAAHQSVRFANFLNSTPLLNEDTLSVEVVTISRTAPLFDYPDKADPRSTAAAWNQAATMNNRISISFEPR